MLRDTLLTFHILGVIVWLGFGFYELLLSREIRNARGTSLEIPLIRIHGRHAGLVAIATLVVAAMGISMSVFLGWGFFQHLWLGIKQTIMLAILVDMALLTPTFKRAFDQIAALDDSDGPGLERCRATLARIHRHVVPMRVGGVVAVVLAVWRPE